MLTSYVDNVKVSGQSEVEQSAVGKLCADLMLHLAALEAAPADEEDEWQEEGDDGDYWHARDAEDEMNADFGGFRIWNDHQEYENGELIETLL